MKRLTYEFVKKFVEDKGGILLSKEYIGAHQKLEIQCKNKHIWKVRIDKLKNNNLCVFCTDRLKKKHGIEECVKIAKQRNGKCLSLKYINSKTKYLWECEQKHQWLAIFENVLNGAWCFECAGLKKHTIEDCCNLAKQRNGKCLSKSYKNNKSNVLWECELGHCWEARYDNVSQGQWCLECSGKKKHTLEDCKQLANERKGSCLSSIYIDSKTKLLWRCFDGHEWLASFNSIQRGTWCPQCSCGKSQKTLFKIIKDFFPNYDIFYNFTNLKWLKTNKFSPLELDIFVSGLKLAIEYDGQQHFYPIESWGGAGAFEKQQYRDQLKNKLISDHPQDIKTFIRIPYWEPITEENVQKILRQNGIL